MHLEEQMFPDHQQFSFEHMTRFYSLLVIMNICNPSLHPRKLGLIYLQRPLHYLLSLCIPLFSKRQQWKTSAIFDTVSTWYRLLTLLRVEVAFWYRMATLRSVEVASWYWIATLHMVKHFSWYAKWRLNRIKVATWYRVLTLLVINYSIRYYKQSFDQCRSCYTVPESNSACRQQLFRLPEIAIVNK